MLKTERKFQLFKEQNSRYDDLNSHCYLNKAQHKR